MKLNKKILNILKLIIFLSIGLFLFWLVYRKQKISEILSAIWQAKIGWLLLSVALGALSHLARALRWEILLKSLGYRPRKKTLFYSVMIMYLTNNAIPRSGELVRCGIVNRYEKTPFSTLLGTVFTERVIDIIMLLILTAIVMITQMNVFLDFFKNNASIQTITDKISNLIWIIGIIALIGTASLLVIYVFRKKIKTTKIYLKLQKIIEDFIAGVKTIIYLDQKWTFIAYSVFIWLAYFIMIYIVFKAFNFTLTLSLLTGLTVFVLSSFGMVFPSPGGIGSWHFIVIETLFIFGVEKSNGSIFAFAAHESQLIMIILLGIISLIATSFLKPINSKIKETQIK